MGWMKGRPCPLATRLQIADYARRVSGWKASGRGFDSRRLQFRLTRGPRTPGPRAAAPTAHAAAGGASIARSQISPLLRRCDRCRLIRAALPLALSFHPDLADAPADVRPLSTKGPFDVGDIARQRDVRRHRHDPHFAQGVRGYGTRANLFERGSA